MNTTARDLMRRAPDMGSDLMRGVIRLGWQVVRLSAVSFLVILEPIVRTVLSSLALMGVLTAFVLEFSSAAPNCPFWLMLAISIGCLPLLALLLGHPIAFVMA